MTETCVVPFVADRRRELRVKIKSLAAEATIIRKEELRVRDAMTRVAGKPEAVAQMASSFASLRSHRVSDVRRESRYALLCYAILRGKPWERVEPRPKAGGLPTGQEVDVEKLTGLLKRFGPSGELAEVRQRVRTWLI